MHNLKHRTQRGTNLNTRTWNEFGCTRVSQNATGQSFDFEQGTAMKSQAVSGSQILNISQKMTNEYLKKGAVKIIFI